MWEGEGTGDLDEGYGDGTKPVKERTNVRRRKGRKTGKSRRRDPSKVVGPKGLTVKGHDTPVGRMDRVSGVRLRSFNKGAEGRTEYSRRFHPLN